MTRYQDCNAVVKCIRWIRWMPCAYMQAAFNVAIWIAGGAEKMKIGSQEFTLTRWETACGFFNRAIGRAHIKMGWYLTMDELREMLSCPRSIVE